MSARSIVLVWMCRLYSVGCWAAVESWRWRVTASDTRHTNRSMCCRFTSQRISPFTGWKTCTGLFSCHQWQKVIKTIIARITSKNSTMTQITCAASPGNENGKNVTKHLPVRIRFPPTVKYGSIKLARDQLPKLSTILLLYFAAIIVQCVYNGLL